MKVTSQTNCTISGTCAQNTGDEPAFKSEVDIDKIDFSYDDYKDGKQALFMQTSGVLYRNVYFKDEYNKDYKRIFDYSFPESFRADGFRFFWYMKAGKVRFDNKICSVYNYNDSGIWASLSEVSQIIANAKAFIAFSEFFEDDSDFYKESCMHRLSSLKNYKNIKDKISKKDINALTKIMSLSQIKRLSFFFERCTFRILIVISSLLRIIPISSFRKNISKYRNNRRHLLKTSKLWDIL
ncbi:hypothetical protein [Succinivibrio sp.]|uniref:hypothetical protein n=1 Tax=Succinivibrio sp. TaxID=2053619 RepID=UPI00386A9103